MLKVWLLQAYRKGKMSEEEYKKYTLQARRGIKGEAFFEALISDYCIPHQIVGPKDIGIDYYYSTWGKMCSDCADKNRSLVDIREDL